MFVLQRYLRKSIDIIRYQGLIVFMWRILVKCVSVAGLLELTELYQKDLRRLVTEFKAKVDVTITLAEESDIPRVAELTALGDGIPPGDIPLVTEKIRLAIEKGDLCFVAKIASEVAHCNWIAFKSRESFARRYIILDEEEAYTRAGHTAGKWRGLGIHSQMNSYMLSFLKSKGFRKAYSCVNRDNISSRKMFSRIGWEKIGMVLSFTPRWPGRGWVWLLWGTQAHFAEKDVPE